MLKTKPLLVATLGLTLVISVVGIFSKPESLPFNLYLRITPKQDSSLLPNLSYFTLVDEAYDNQRKIISIALYSPTVSTDKPALDDLLYAFKIASSKLPPITCVPTYLEDDSCRLGYVSVGRVTSSQTIPSPLTGETAVYIYANQRVLILDQYQIFLLLNHPPSTLEDLELYILAAMLSTSSKGASLFIPDSLIFVGLRPDTP